MNFFYADLKLKFSDTKRSRTAHFPAIVSPFLVKANAISEHHPEISHNDEPRSWRCWFVLESTMKPLKAHMVLHVRLGRFWHGLVPLLQKY